MDFQGRDSNWHCFLTFSALPVVLSHPGEVHQKVLNTSSRAQRQGGCVMCTNYTICMAGWLVVTVQVLRVIKVGSVPMGEAR